MKPPKIEFDENSLSEDSAALHEMLVAAFGEYMMWCREEALRNVKSLVESEEARSRIARVNREVFEKAEKEMSPEQREIAEQLQSKAIGDFARLLLTLLSGTGFDQPLGKDHVARFRLIMEVCDTEEGEIVKEEILNRGGKKFFPEYWARWLNEYRKRKT